MGTESGIGCLVLSLALTFFLYQKFAVLKAGQLASSVLMFELTFLISVTRCYSFYICLFCVDVWCDRFPLHMDSPGRQSLRERSDISNLTQIILGSIFGTLVTKLDIFCCCQANFSYWSILCWSFTIHWCSLSVQRIYPTQFHMLHCVSKTTCLSAEFLITL